MTGELTSRCVADSRPSRSSHQHHHQLLHASKTDEIEILESGGGGGIEEQHETKVSFTINLLLLYIDIHVQNILSHINFMDLSVLCTL